MRAPMRSPLARAAHRGHAVGSDLSNPPEHLGPMHKHLASRDGVMGRRCTPHSPRLPRLVAPAATWVFGPRQAPVPQPGTRGPAPARRPRPLTPATRGQHDGGLAQSRFWSTTGYGHRRRPLQNRDWRAAPATGYPSHAGRLLRPRPQHRTAAGSTTPAATTEYKPSQTPSGGSPHRPAHRNQQRCGCKIRIRDPGPSR